MCMSGGVLRRCQQTITHFHLQLGSEGRSRGGQEAKGGGRIGTGRDGGKEPAKSLQKPREGFQEEGCGTSIWSSS